MLISGKRKKHNRLAWEILGFMVMAFVIAGIIFCFLYSIAESIASVYLIERQIFLTEVQQAVFQMWLRSICLAASCVAFLVLFLFMLGQKLSYLVAIIRGVEALEQRDENYQIPLKGKDELTELAQSIHYLSKSQQMLAQKEKEIKEEREAWIRSVSHDIRTPLTSILSYSQFMKEKDKLTQEEIYSYISLMESKAEQIKALADGLLGEETDFWEAVDDGRLFMEQLASEWEEVLEDQFSCQTDLTECQKFSGNVSIRGIRRIFDNLVSNAEKYADKKYPVELIIKSDGEWLILIQRNKISKQEGHQTESHKIGLNSIRQIAKFHGGNVQINSDGDTFEIEISLQIRF